MAVAARVEDAGPDVVVLAEQALGELAEVMSPWLPRVETRAAAGQYVRGLASMVERKNSWQLAEHAGHAGPDRFQRLLASSAWDEHGLREDVACWVAVRAAAQGATPHLSRRRAHQPTPYHPAGSPHPTAVMS